MDANGSAWKERGKDLDALLHAYAASIPEVDASPEFMPRLWDRIDKRRNSAFRLAKAFATAAVALCILLCVMLVYPDSSQSAFYSSSYVDVLAQDHAPDQLVYADVRYESFGETR
ncbi:MAG: hypothetical protein LC130_02410 [Bryobacterales bacterium]|nr:hypothetical protein [Bryobacterales bacterium]MEB2362506.1 hypothetical protein [Bryobacterales bacterium]